MSNVKANSVLIILIIITCFISFKSHAQQYYFKQYSTSNGLGSASINHIFQDSKGYIWFATQGGGVSKYNGKTFSTFTQADGLINNDVTYITEDKKGNIWIGTASGASKYNGTTFKSFNDKNGLSKSIVYCIYVDSDNAIWFATQDAGVKIYSNNSFTSISTNNGLATNEVFCITQNAKDNYWFGLSNGIAQYKNGKVISHNTVEYLKEKVFFSTCRDSSRNILMGSSSGELISITENNTIEKIALPASVNNDFIGGITTDKQGSVWLAVDHGLLKYNDGQFKLFSEKEGFSSSPAQTVLSDYEGCIWTGTLGGGAYLFKNEAWQHYTSQDALLAKNITAFAAAPNGKDYFIGSNSGIYLFNENAAIKFIKMNSDGLLDNESIKALSIDALGHFWVATANKITQWQISATRLKLINTFTQIAGEDILEVTQILHDSENNCWIATYGSGLLKINKNKQIAYNLKNKFVSNKILSVFEDAQKNIWVGTQDAGLVKIKAKGNETIGSNTNSVWCITENNKGHIYWATGENGFYSYDGTSIINYNAKTHDISSNNIVAIQYEPQNNSLWLGSEKGLDKIIWNDQNKIVSINNYFEQGAINHHALMLFKNGCISIGTNNGLWLLNNQYIPSVQPFKINLSSMRLFYEKTNWSNWCKQIDSSTQLPINLHLPYNKNHLTFYMEAFTHKNVQYRYKLEGLDDNWTTYIDNHEITYANLDYGKHYVFKAKALAADGSNSRDAIEFSFSISPPWWATWWFRLLVAVIAIGLLIFIIKAREKVLVEQNKNLEATVKKRTYEIAQQKELVEHSLQEKEKLLQEKEVLLKEIHHRVKNNLQTISSLLMLQGAGLKDVEAKKAISESQNRVQSIALVHQKLYQTDGIEKVELQSFINDLSIQIHSFYKKQSPLVEITIDIPQVFILIDIAIPLGLIINELLTNSFKYAFANNENGTINISSNYLLQEANIKSSKKISLRYTDSGKGFDEEKILKSNTLGLRLLKLLSQQIGAKMTYSNQNGSEFIFTFSINL